MVETKKIPGKENIHHNKSSSKEKAPDFMVQINDPKVIRKDLLESLREVIIFMQGYEKFRKVQEEKVNTFNQLKAQVKEINNFVEKLKTLLPKGKLKSLGENEYQEYKPDTAPEQVAAPSRSYSEPKATGNELDELESQLKDIEGQLRNIQ